MRRQSEYVLVYERKSPGGNLRIATEARPRLPQAEDLQTCPSKAALDLRFPTNHTVRDSIRGVKRRWVSADLRKQGFFGPAFLNYSWREPLARIMYFASNSKQIFGKLSYDPTRHQPPPVIPFVEKPRWAYIPMWKE
jgi:hypothetical protein